MLAGWMVSGALQANFWRAKRNATCESYAWIDIQYYLKQ